MNVVNRTAAAAAIVVGLVVIPGSALAQPAAAPGVPPMTLTLDQAVQRALERNLDIAVERSNPQTYDFQVAALKSIYYPSVTSTLGTRSNVNPPTSQLNGGQRVINDTYTFNAGVGQALPWGGGTFAFSFNNAKTDTSNIFANFNPSYVSNMSAVLTQPILRGFKIDAARQQILVTQINRDISEVQLRATITATLASVRNAYWDLVVAKQAVDVARSSLELAEKLVEDNKVRVEVGAMAPIDVVQAEAEAATRRQSLAQIEATAQTAELVLKRLIVDGVQDPLWRAPVLPVERPAFRPEPIDIDAAIAVALSKRTDLDQSRRQLESADVSVRYYRNQSLPAVDVVGSYGLQGLGGTQFLRQGSGLGSVIIGTIPGGYGDAWGAIRQADYPNWSVALNVTYPLMGNAAEAQLARTRVQRSQTVAQIKALELQVAAEVTNAGLTVMSNQKRVEAAVVARELAERRLEAEQSKFEVGLSTNFFVVQAQRDLLDAQITELRTMLDYQKSLVDFERVQETSLTRAGIAIRGSAGN